MKASEEYEGNASGTEWAEMAVDGMEVEAGGWDNKEGEGRPYTGTTDLEGSDPPSLPPPLAGGKSRGCLGSR